MNQPKSWQTLFQERSLEKQHKFLAIRTILIPVQPGQSRLHFILYAPIFVLTHATESADFRPSSLTTAKMTQDERARKRLVYAEQHRQQQ
mgnify:CR=1 FL=1